MKVHYNSGLWDRGKGLFGIPQRTNWEFEYAGARRCIPVIYRFPKGIVFDIITFLDEPRLREFYEKYEGIEESLTPLQRRCAEQEHPYQGLSVKEIWINGERVEGGYSSSGAMSIPWAEQLDELVPVRKAYSSILGDGACFACERFCVPYPETDSIAEKLKRLLRIDRIKGLKLSTYPMERFYPLDIHFDMTVEDDQKEVKFEHPITGTHYTLYLQNPKPVEIPLRGGGIDNFYVIQAMYEIEPELAREDTLQFNSSMEYTEPIERKLDFAPTGSGSIGIIGGADGPTSIFMATGNIDTKMPTGVRGLPLSRCFSISGFEDREIFHFVLEGISIIEYDSQDSVALH